MLEWGDVLRTWRLLEKPGESSCLAAEALADHRTAYLDYEGPVSGGRGAVTRVDQGTVDVLEERPDMLRLRFAGTLLAGDYVLSGGGDEGLRWTLQFAPRAD